jgi:hypothetical protein
MHFRNGGNSMSDCTHNNSQDNYIISKGFHDRLVKTLNQPGIMCTDEIVKTTYQNAINLFKECCEEAYQNPTNITFAQLACAYAVQKLRDGGKGIPNFSQIHNQIKERLKIDNSFTTKLEQTRSELDNVMIDPLLYSTIKRFIDDLL